MQASDAFEIHGGKPLKGELRPQGAKNEALEVICAVLLTSDEVIISNIPNILDVVKLIDILREMGVKVNRINENTYSFKADEPDLQYLQSEEFGKQAGKLRGSTLLVGPLLARFGKARLPRPGGDKIGRRRLDAHFLGLQELGAKFEYNHIANEFTINTGKGLQGTYLLMEEPSLTGTANIIMAAVLASGTTTIYHAACEPYTQQLCQMLNRMGAKIQGIGSNLLTIEGVRNNSTAAVIKYCPICWRWAAL